MFKICQGTCFCAAGGSKNGPRQETVLYCFGEVVLKKDSLRGEDSSKKSFSPENLDEYHLQLTQIVITFVLFLLV